MSTEDLYQDDVESLDDYDEQIGEQQWADVDVEEQPGLSSDEPDEPIGPDEQDEQDEHSPLSAVDSLPLDLTLRCGELRLTLAELRRLDAGTVLEVSGIAPGYATLCHGERVVAEGELVDVDGRLGLQITRLAAQP
ncbi:FliM/FliN family flagellar motor switch protein [Pseudomonas caricapapayae]|uniref:FliM/FliN family flagellar motor switch protein n=1 Tax=Pseudomonas caricapapayae TaxID=46678 RepID=UPI000F00C55A|nr:FliM/FliN family flagellar motor switch protein [Pseudomonas caricapapayae]